MRHDEWRAATMIAPRDGFTGRVMARIAERERTAARRRAMLGVGLLVAAAVGLLAFVGGVLLLMASTAVDVPDMLVSAWVALAPVLDVFSPVGQALWVSSVALADNVSLAPMLVYALMVAAIVVLWARVVTGSTQLLPHSILTGEQK